MYLLNQDKDNILSIVKSLHPIKYLYSKQNKDLDKYFRGSSLKDLIKQINRQRKFNEFLKPGESLDEVNNQKTIMDINFKSTFNYIDEFSNLKNLPISVLIKSGNQINKKPNENINSKKMINTIRLNESLKKRSVLKAKKEWDSKVTLDPGRYHPNYDFIKRRYPCAILGRNKKENNDINNDKKEEKKNSGINEKSKKKEKSINEIIYNNNKITKTMKNKHPKNKQINESISNRTYVDKSYNNLESNKKINFNISNYYSMYKKNYSKKFNTTSLHKDKFTSSILKDQNTASSWTNTIDFENSKKLSEHHKSKDRNRSLYNNSKIHFYSTQRGNCALRKDKKELLKNSSMENFKCPIIFEKMQGRDRPLDFNIGTKETLRTSYNPEYNIIRPHIPSYIFKSERKYQDFKKYINGKIIRSYCYNPEEYFVFEYKENKEKEISGQYGTIVLGS